MDVLERQSTDPRTGRIVRAEGRPDREPGILRTFQITRFQRLIDRRGRERPPVLLLFQRLEPAEASRHRNQRPHSFRMFESEVDRDAPSHRAPDERGHGDAERVDERFQIADV